VYWKSSSRVDELSGKEIISEEEDMWLVGGNPSDINSRFFWWT